MKDDPTMSDTTTDEIEGVPVEADVDPEPDETTGGDSVQLVGTGWIRFVIGDRRIRFRPARFGELRRLSESLDELTEAVDAYGDEKIAEAEVFDAEIQAQRDAAGNDPTAVAKINKTARRRSAKISQEIQHRTEDLRIAWWRDAHAMLGVSGEEFPADDDLPSWILSPHLIQTCSSHWRTVPLDRGRKAPTGT